MAGLLAALALCAQPIPADAQPSVPLRRIGFLGMDSGMQATRFAAFRDELKRQGFVDGENLVIETRWAQGQFDRLPALAEELVAWRPEVIAAAAAPPLHALRKATGTIPIVTVITNPVEQGVAASLSRPGGNVTGIAPQDSDVSVRRLDLLRSVVPDLRRVAIVWNMAGGGTDALHTVERAAGSMKIATMAFEVRSGSDLRKAIEDAKLRGAQAVLQLASPFITFHRKVLLDALADQRMPATCETRLYVEEGCLMSYGADLDAAFRGMAVMAVRILKGAKPADLPIEQPREFDFAMNMKTAGTLGLTIPKAIQLQLTDRIQ